MRRCAPAFGVVCVTVASLVVARATFMAPQAVFVTLAVSAVARVTLPRPPTPTPFLSTVPEATRQSAQAPTERHPLEKTEIRCGPPARALPAAATIS